MIRRSQVLIFEPPVGIKSSLLRTFKGLPPARVNRAPAERYVRLLTSAILCPPRVLFRSRLYFLLAWLHAVVLERLRYVPVGWSKGFEFSEVRVVEIRDDVL